MSNCPYCECEMKKGFIEGDGRNPLIWVEESKKRNFISKLTNGDCIVLDEAKIIHKTSVECYYCVHCKKIIIDTK